MWFRRFLDPFAQFALPIGLTGMAVLPVTIRWPDASRIPAMVIETVLGVAAIAMILARLVWTLNKMMLTGGGPGLSDPGELNQAPMQTRWFSLRGFDRYLYFLLMAFVLEYVLLGGAQDPPVGRLWFFWMALFLVATSHYTWTAVPSSAPSEGNDDA